MKIGTLFGFLKRRVLIIIFSLKVTIGSSLPTLPESNLFSSRTEFLDDKTQMY